MVAQQHHRWHLEFLHLVSSPDHLLGSTEVRDVATVNHEVDAVFSPVDVVHRQLQVVEPLMAVADYGKPDGILVLHRFFNLPYILGIQVSISLHPHVVGVHVEHGVASSHHHHACDAAEACAQGDFLSMCKIPHIVFLLFMQGASLGLIPLL